MKNEISYFALNLSKHFPVFIKKGFYVFTITGFIPFNIWQGNYPRKASAPAFLWMFLPKKNIK